MMKRLKGLKQARKCGQVMIFFILVLVILVFIALWNFDLHKLIYVKNISQNGGDAAAVMAARWQAQSLNLMGDLNLMKAIALSSEDTDTVESIDRMQARLCYTGPMVALYASQQAAKNNGIFPNDAYSDFLMEHARVVREEYTAPVGPGGDMLFPEPYPGAWNEYADMLELAAGEGIAAGPDNMRLYSDGTGGHTLLNYAFYEAIAGRNWCWFYHNEPTLLEDYRNFFPSWWPPLPSAQSHYFINSEIYSLGLTKDTTSLDSYSFGTLGDFNELAETRGFGPMAINQEGMTNSATWYCYGQNWGTWDAMDVSGAWSMPLAGPVRPEYDYSGADAAVRVEASTSRLTPGPDGTVISNTIVWSAGAKPLGHLNDEDRPNAFDLVIPAFTSARLIPVDASSAPSGGSFNLAWREHVENHLPDYMAHGPRRRGCWYCDQLVTWESRAFRQEGIDWLELYSDRCTAGGGGGGHHGGGSRRGH